MPSLEQELDRAGADVAHRLREPDRGAAHALAQLRVHGRRGRFLDQFLVAPLHRAVALAEVDAVAVLVGEHLHFDVARVEERLSSSSRESPNACCASERAVFERRAARFRRRTSRMPRPPPPAAALIIIGKPMRGASISAHRPFRPARQPGMPARRRRARRAAPALSPIAGSPPAAADPGQSGVDHGLRETRARREAIARMHRIGAVLPRRRAPDVRDRISRGAAPPIRTA